MTHQSPAPVAGRPLTAEADPIEPCGGCGETNPSRRCLGCLHDFVSRPASDQPVEAIGAGREALEANEEIMLAAHDALEAVREKLRGDPDHALYDQVNKALYGVRGRPDLRAILAALSPASPARTPMTTAPSPERQPAVPKYAIGDHVQYIDHHNRMQSGKVYRIEASWASYMKNGPLIIYTVSHPTYRNNRFYAGEAKIISAPPSVQPVEGK